MKILISGGHLTPALALIDYLEEVRPDITIIFAGREKMQHESDQPAHEKRLVSLHKNVVFEPFDSGKWGVGSIFYKLNQLYLTLVSLPKAVRLISKHKPKLFISFGGYLALPLAVAAKLLGVPIVTHEQTRAAGIANQLIAKIADKVAISYPDSLPYFPSKKTLVTGNLIRSLETKPKVKPRWFRLKSQKPILYVTGGSQGSEIINTTISQILPLLLKDWIIIHQCGPKSKTRNYLKELTALKQTLPLKLQSHYLVREWLDESELAWVYHTASLVVGRAGANTVAELKLYSLPAIFIPLELAHHDEQTKNALSLVRAQAASIIPQSELTPERLATEIKVAKAQLSKLKAAYKKLAPEKNGTEKFFKLIEPYLKNET